MTKTNTKKDNEKYIQRANTKTKTKTMTKTNTLRAPSKSGPSDL